jgi:FtsP/CotA-like multicopper oxidase with cupredoxin domain
MRTRRLLVVLALVAGGFITLAGQGLTEPKMPKMRSTTQKQRKAAAANQKKKGLTVLGAPAAAALGTTAPAPGATPDYFGAYANFANSPLPGGPLLSVTLTAAGDGYTCANPTVTISDLYGVGTAAGATAAVSTIPGPITSLTMDSPGSGYVYPQVTITDCADISGNPGPGAGATATATLDLTALSGGLRKFVDTPPGLVTATPDTTTYPGTDYYEIELGEYNTWQFHADLGTTQMRGYRQTNMGGTPFSYLGPTIVATKGRPTRIKFTNNLPVGAAGDLFIPTDTTVMGAGSGYDPATNSMATYTENRGTLHLHGGFTPWISDGTPHQWVTPAGETNNLTNKLKSGVSTKPVPDMPIPSGESMTFYWPNEQSGRLMFYHDHVYGLTRLNVYAGEAAGYLLTDPVERKLTDGTTPGVPQMPEIPLVIQDRSFVWGAPAAGSTPASGTWATDPTWNWGQSRGSLWFPHVYMPNQNPWDTTGANAMGRWDYALWFWPPFTGLLAHGTATNPYYDPVNAPWEPPEIPGTPNPSLVPEAFMDTPVVNGKAYPVIHVPAGPVRFRILNAANDRFWNLSLFVAADKTVPTAAGSNVPLTAFCTGGVLAANCTEVAMVPASTTALCGGAACPFPASWTTPTDGPTVPRPDILDARLGGVPDPRGLGPDWVQIGTEGGLLPAPAVIPASPIGYQYNPRNIVIGNVTLHSLFLGPAERADAIVDFSSFAGQTLILYNDAPAPVPALDSRIDYFTGGPDQTSTGGAPTTLPGYGPNTRTVMQIQVDPAGATTGSFNLASLRAAFNSTGTYGQTGFAPGAFAASQDPILVAQAPYSSAYNGKFTAAVGANPSAYARIQDTSLTFSTVAGTTLTNYPMTPKAIQELFELDYGRMNATLGVELPFTNGNNQTTLPMGYTEPPTEIINASSLISVPAAGDGTQLWKITHNGVDTHAIHVHLFNVQVINRVGWDGAIRPPEPNELGWKETVRMNPLEDIIVALRPTVPPIPFGLPNSVRLLSPAEAPGTLISTFDTVTGNPTTVANAPYNFGWEYVWHCHLLGHEENDMMRPTVFSVPTVLPAAPNPVTAIRSTAAGTVALTWTDGTPFNYVSQQPTGTLGNPANEIGFVIQRAPVGNNGKPGAYVQIGTALANVNTFTDPNAGPSATWSYIVVAFNASGNSPSTPLIVTVPPTAPSNMVATLQAGPQIRLTWIDNSNNETNFVVERQIGGGAFGTLATLASNTTTYTDTTVQSNTTYTYRVKAANNAGSSAYATSSPIAVPPVPTAPGGLAVSAVRANGSSDNVILAWSDSSNNETGFTIQRCTGTAATCLAANATWTAVVTTAANATTYTQTSVSRATNYCYRIRSTNLGGSSAWTNGVPFPILTP